MARPGSSAARVSDAAFASAHVDADEGRPAAIAEALASAGVVDADEARDAEVDPDARSSLRAYRGERLDAWVDGWVGDVSWPDTGPAYHGRLDIMNASSGAAINGPGTLWVGAGLTSVDAGRVALLMAEDVRLVHADLVFTPAPGVSIPARLLSRADPADAFAPTGVVTTIHPAARQLMLDPGLDFARGAQLVWEFDVPAGVTAFWVGESFAIDLQEP